MATSSFAGFWTGWWWGHCMLMQNRTLASARPAMTAQGRYPPSAISMNERRVIDVAHLESGYSGFGHTKPPDEWRLFRSIREKRSDRIPPISVTRRACLNVWFRALAGHRSIDRDGRVAAVHGHRGERPLTTPPMVICISGFQPCTSCCSVPPVSRLSSGQPGNTADTATHRPISRSFTRYHVCRASSAATSGDGNPGQPVAVHVRAHTHAAEQAAAAAIATLQRAVGRIPAAPRRRSAPSGRHVLPPRLARAQPVGLAPRRAAGSSAISLTRRQPGGDGPNASVRRSPRPGGCASTVAHWAVTANSPAASWTWRDG